MSAPAPRRNSIEPQSTRITMEQKKQELLKNLKLKTAPPEQRPTVEEQKQVLLSIPLRFKTTPEEAEPLVAAFAVARDKAEAEKAARDAARALAWSKLSDAERREAEALAAIEDEEVADSERRNLKKAQSASVGHNHVGRGPADSAPAPAPAHPALKKKMSLPSSRILPGTAEDEAESAPASAEAAAGEPNSSGTQARLSALPQAVQDAIAKKTQAADSEAPKAGADSGPRHKVGDSRELEAKALEREKGMEGKEVLEQGDAADAKGPTESPSAATAVSSSARINIQGIFVKSKSDSFVALSKSQRYIIFDEEGFKWFHVAPGGGAGKLRGVVPWAQVRGAARVGEYDGLFGAQILHPGVKADVSFLWCETELQRDEIVAAIMTEIVAAINIRKEASVAVPR